jgi:hypothetical protein
MHRPVAQRIPIFFSYCSRCLKNNEEEDKGILKKRTKVDKEGTKKKLGK